MPERKKEYPEYRGHHGPPSRMEDQKESVDCSPLRALSGPPGRRFPPLSQPAGAERKCPALQGRPHCSKPASACSTLGEKQAKGACKSKTDKQNKSCFAFLRAGRRRSQAEECLEPEEEEGSGWILRPRKGLGKRNGGSVGNVFTK